MTTKTTKTTKTEAPTVDKALLISFVNDCATYKMNSARLDKLKDEQADLISKNGELRKAIVPVFKSLGAHKWDAIKKDIKNAIIEAEITDVDGLLGVLRTSFEYKILPTQANADRLRKAEKWVNWLGLVVPNTYKAVQVKKEEPAPNMAKTIEAVKTAIQTATASAPSATEKKGEIARPNVTATSDSITTSEYWDTLYAQFIKHGMTAFYIKALAGALNTTESALFKTMTTVHDDIMTQAQKIEAKK